MSMEILFYHYESNTIDVIKNWYSMHASQEIDDVRTKEEFKMAA